MNDERPQAHRRSRLLRQAGAGNRGRSASSHCGLCCLLAGASQLLAAAASADHVCPPGRRMQWGCLTFAGRVNEQGSLGSGTLWLPGTSRWGWAERAAECQPQPG